MPNQPNLPPNLLYFGICDDIRVEEGGKLTVVGLYGRSMRIGKIPATLSKLCLFAQFPLFDLPAALDIRLVSPSGVLLLEARNARILPVGKRLNIPNEYQLSQVIVHIVPMPLNEEGRYRVGFVFPNRGECETDFFVIQDPSLISPNLSTPSQ
jgi:hypothetical protein